MTRTSGAVGGISSGQLSMLDVERRPLRQVANRGRVPINLGSAATANSLCAETRRRHQSGGKAISELRLVFSGYYVDCTGTGSATNGQELPCGNDVGIEAAIEIPGAPNQVVRVTFDGGAAGTIGNNVAEYVSDPIYPSQFGLEYFTASTEFYVRDRRTIALGQRFVRHGSVASLAGESTRLSDGASASQVMNSGALVTPSGGSSLFCCFAPTAIVGRALDGHDIAIGGLGDSILNGSNDPILGGASDGSDGHGGWFTLGLWNCAGRAVPHILMAGNGTTVQGATDKPDFASAFAKRRVLLKYLTHVVDNYGTNDFGQTTPQDGPTTMARRRRLWAMCRSAGIRHVAVVPILPRADSSDGFATVTNQIPRAGYGTSPSDFRNIVNTALVDALATRKIDGLIDLNAVIADSAMTTRWKAGATDDGTHPAFSSVADLAGMFRAWAAAQH